MSLQGAGAGVGIVGAAATIAQAKGLTDNNNTANTTVITNSFDSVNLLTPNESYNLIATNDKVKDTVASHIYYKDIGSRSGQSIAESDVAFSNATETTKRVYRNKAVTDVRKLITDGYIKINRETQDITVNIEKANL